MVADGRMPACELQGRELPQLGLQGSWPCCSIGWAGGLGLGVWVSLKAIWVFVCHELLSSPAAAS